MSVRKDEVQLSIEINGVKAGSTLNQLKQQARDLTREISKLVPGTAEFAAKALELQKVNNVLASIRKTTAGVAGEIGKVNPLLDIFKKGAVAAAAFFTVDRVITWGKEFVSWVVRGTVALEDMQDKNRRVFRDAIGIVEDFAASNAQQLGVTEEKYVSLAAKIGALLTPLGLAREETAKLASEATNISGALSEWSNGTVSVEQANDLLAKAMTGRTKGLLELGIAIKDTDIKDRLLAQGQERLTGRALSLAKAQATLQLVYERTADAQDEFNASQGDLGRSQIRITALFDQFKENILQKYLPGLQKLAAAVTNVFSPPKQQSDILEDNRVKFNVLIESLSDVNLTIEGRKKLIAELNTLYPEYLQNINLETASTSQLKELLIDTNDQFERRIRLQRTIEQRTSLANQAVDLEDQQNDFVKKIHEQEERLKILEGKEGFLAKQSRKDADNLITFYNGQIELVKSKRALIDSQINDVDAALKSQGFDPQADAKRRADASAEAERRRLEAEAEIQRQEDEKAAREKEARAEKARQDRLKQKEQEINAIRALEKGALQQLVLDEEEFNDRLAVIDLTAERDKIAAKLSILKLSEDDTRIILQDIADKQIEIDAATNKLSLDNTLRHIKEVGVLQRQSLKENINDQVELQEAIDQQRIDEEIKTLEAQLAAKSKSDADYLDLQDKLDAALKKKHEQLLAQNEREFKAFQTAFRIETLKALEQQGLDEENFLIAKRRLTLQYAIEDQEALIALYKEGTQERYDAEQELARRISELNDTSFRIPFSAANTGGSSSPGDKDKQNEKLKQIEDASINSANSIAGAQQTINQNRIDQELAAELSLIDAIEKRKLEAAGDDAVAKKKIQAQADRDRLEAERHAARERKKLARKEAAIQGALAVIEALPNGFAVAAAIIGTAAQLAVIDQQSFDKGGFTPGKGLYKDRAGKDVAGVVHINEWVANAKTVSDPETGPIIRELDRVQRLKRGFADGGYTSVTTAPARFNQASSTLDQNELREIKAILYDMRGIVAAWPTVIRAVMAYTDFEKVKGDVDYIRDQASA